MTVKDGNCEHCEHFVKDAYGQWVCEFDGECENMVREMTNEEWFCSLSTEEKAEFLVMIQMSVMRPVKRGAVDMEKFIEEVAEWLKNPHKGE